MRVYVNLYQFNHMPDPETGQQHPDDQIAFVVPDTSLALSRVLNARTELQPLNETADLQDLVGRIETLPSLAWAWINLWIRVQVRYSKDNTGDWGAAQLWQNTLEPWLPWVR